MCSINIISVHAHVIVRVVAVHTACTLRRLHLQPKIACLCVCVAMGRKVRGRQPADSSLEDRVFEILQTHAPASANARAIKDGNLIKYAPRGSSIIDKIALEDWAPALEAMVKINPSAIFNQTTLSGAIKRFDKDTLGNAMNNSDAHAK